MFFLSSGNESIFTINRDFNNPRSWDLFFIYFGICMTKILCGFVSSGRTRRWNDKGVSIGIHRFDWEIKFLIATVIALFNSLIQWAILTGKSGSISEDSNLIGVQNLFFIIYIILGSAEDFSVIRVIYQFKAAASLSLIKLLVSLIRMGLIFGMKDVLSSIFAVVLVLLDVFDSFIFIRAVKVQNEMNNYEELATENNIVDGNDDVDLESSNQSSSSQSQSKEKKKFKINLPI